MSSHRANRVAGPLRQVAELTEAQASDGQLLAAFLAHRDEAAFAALVRRYGPMVFAVCRRVLRHTPDAEDAFQASFLVLVRRAAEVRCRATLGNWLYGVAFRTAQHARTVNARRRRLEGQARPGNQGAAPEDTAMQTELHELLDQELNALPDKYREPIVLCDLLGTTKREAANHLGCPEGTLSSRLARGREMLRKRLVRRGVTLPVAAVAGALGENKVPASALLIDTTVKTAALLAAGNAVAAGGLAPKAALLMEGVLKSMLLTKLKIVAGVLLVLFVLGATTTLVARNSMGVPQPLSRGPSPELGAEGKVAQVKEAEDAVPSKERLLYEEKNFAHWRDVLRYDLSQATRIKALEALAAFGANGYADEVTASILDVMRKYDPMKDNPLVVAAAQMTLVSMGAEGLRPLGNGWEKGTLNQRRFVAETLVRAVEQARPPINAGFQGNPIPPPPPNYPPEVVPLLIRVLKDKDSIVRRLALGGLRGALQYAPRKDDKPVVPKRKEIGAALATVLETDEDASLRAEAAQSLWWWTRNDEGNFVSPVLMRSAAEDPSLAVRTSSVNSLAGYPNGAKLVPFMLKRMENETERDSREQVLHGIALGVSGKMAYLTDPEANAISACFYFFQELNPDQPENITALITAVKTNRSVVARNAVVMTLEHMGPKAKAAVPALQQLLDGKNPETDPVVREAVTKALKAIQPKQ